MLGFYKVYLMKWVIPTYLCNLLQLTSVNKVNTFQTYIFKQNCIQIWFVGQVRIGLYLFQICSHSCYYTFIAVFIQELNFAAKSFNFCKNVLNCIKIWQIKYANAFSTYLKSYRVLFKAWKQSTFSSYIISQKFENCRSFKTKFIKNILYLFLTTFVKTSKIC